MNGGALKETAVTLLCFPPQPLPPQTLKFSTPCFLGSQQKSLVFTSIFNLYCSF